MFFSLSFLILLNLQIPDEIFDPLVRITPFERYRVEQRAARELSQAAPALAAHADRVKNSISRTGSSGLLSHSTSSKRKPSFSGKSGAANDHQVGGTQQTRLTLSPTTINMPKAESADLKDTNENLHAAASPSGKV